MLLPAPLTVRIPNGRDGSPIGVCASLERICARMKSRSDRMSNMTCLLGIGPAGRRSRAMLCGEDKLKNRRKYYYFRSITYLNRQSCILYASDAHFIQNKIDLY